MTEREWIAYKNSQLEMLFVIRQAQVTARWAITMAKATIEQAKRHRITFTKERK